MSKYYFAKFMALIALGFFMVLWLTPSAYPAGASKMFGVRIMTKETVGDYLVDGNGMTLYLFIPHPIQQRKIWSRAILQPLPEGTADSRQPTGACPFTISRMINTRVTLSVTV